MKVVYKYRMPNWPGRTTIKMKKDAVILRLDSQASAIQAWALVDEDAPDISINIRVIETGIAFDDAIVGIIGTVLQEAGDHVLHIFEVV